MGNCNHCGKGIDIKNNEGSCPNCNMNPYFCWNCNTEIFIDKKECSCCGYVVCSNCKNCAPNCISLKILANTKNLSEIEKIRYIYNIKNGNVRMTCKRKVGISYAHGKLRQMAVKLKGFYVNKEDRKEYENRMGKIIDFPIGKQWAISGEKEPGFHGVELRESSNLAVCMGFAIKENKKKEDGTKYELFKRINGNACEHMNWNKLVINRCDKCEKTYDGKVEVCNICVYKKGFNKGEPRKLKKRLSHLKFCQMNRNEFEVKLKKEEDVYGKVS